MSSKPVRFEEEPTSPGHALELVTRVPPEVFDALPLVAQAAVVARLVPERLRCLDVAGAEAVIAVTQRAVNALAAMQDLALAACVRADELAMAELTEDGFDGEKHRPDSIRLVASSVAPILHSSPRGVVARVARAVRVSDEMPCTLARALSGDLDQRQVAVISDHADAIDVDAVPLFDRALHAVEGVCDLPPSRLRRTCERAAMAVDPDAIEQRAEQALADRFVRIEPGVDPGMAFWTASLPSMDSARAWSAVDELAHEYVRADPGRSIDQARADALLDLVLGQAQVTTTVELVVPTSTDAGPRILPEGVAVRNVDPPSRSAEGACRSGDGGACRSGDGGACRSDDCAGDDCAGTDCAGTDCAGTDCAGTRCSPAVGGPGAVEPSGALLRDLGLVMIAGPRLGEAFAIGSELFGPGCADLADLPERAAATLLILQQEEAALAQLQASALARLDGQGLGPGQWRPPQVGVRDPKAGWVLSSALVDVLTDPDIRLRITRSDALTGVTVARDPQVYRPNAALARRVRDRDRTCRFPGCGVAARRCDVDHVVAYPDGDTCEANLLCLCRTHHGFKHHAGWLLEMAGDGTCTWRAPTGRVHLTRPADIRLRRRLSRVSFGSQPRAEVGERGGEPSGIRLGVHGWECTAGSARLVRSGTQRTDHERRRRAVQLSRRGEVLRDRPRRRRLQLALPDLVRGREDGLPGLARLRAVLVR